MAAIAQIALSKITAGEQRLDQLSDNTLRFLAEALDAQVGAFSAEMETRSGGPVRMGYRPGRRCRKNLNLATASWPKRLTIIARSRFTTCRIIIWHSVLPSAQ